MPAVDAVLVLTTVGTAEAAVDLVRALLARRVVACGTLLPGARSLYRWEGRVADESEVVVLLKTRRTRLSALEAAFGELHPYTLPELLAFDAAGGIDRNLGWSPDEPDEQAT